MFLFYNNENSTKLDELELYSIHFN